jgi:hypothetical protein
MATGAKERHPVHMRLSYFLPLGFALTAAMALMAFAASGSI